MIDELYRLAPTGEWKDQAVILNKILSYLHEEAGSGGGFTDRGDPSGEDYTQATLTMDGTWRDLDLSSIVTDSNAKAVLLRVQFKNSSTGLYMSLRKNGNSNGAAVNTMFNQVANIYTTITAVVPCDTSQVIEYFVSAAADGVVIVVLGWWT